MEGLRGGGVEVGEMQVVRVTYSALVGFGSRATGGGKQILRVQGLGSRVQGKEFVITYDLRFGV